MPKKAVLAALALALLGAGLIKRHVDAVTAAAWGGPPRAILALTADLDRGQRLAADDVVEAHVPARYVESRHIPARERDTLIGLRIAGPVKAGELLLMTDLAGVQTTSGRLSTLVGEGLRAMPIRVANAGFARLVQPGDRVDILHSGARGTPLTTRTLLENVQVLAIGTTVWEPGAPAAAAGGRVTLGVTPDQSHTLANAQSTGTLRLTLRSPTDHVTKGRPHAG